MWSVDIDFQDDRREEVIAYVKRKYGEDCVSNIITFGNMKSKSAVRDMARVLDYPPQMGDKIAKLIPDKVKNLKDALNNSIELKDLYDADKDVRKIVDGAIKIEGLPKSTGKHACGVLISPRPVTEFIPQVIVMDKKEEKNDKGEVEYEEVMVTQVDMTECEELGLLKMDFLGLKTLTIIAKALALANKKRVSQGLPELTTKDIPLNDPYAYQHIKEGNTLGVFQLESPGMTDLVSKTYSDISNFIEKFEENQSFTEKGVGIFSKEFSALFERLIALISLYRPGPMDEIPNYLHQMNNPQDIEYDTEESKEILKETFGIIVYQEQVMHMVREMAGFSKGQSDVIRKAMGKKKKEIVDEYGEYFIYGSSRVDKELIKEGKEPHNIEGCVPRGKINEEQAKVLWEKMYKFSAYAFNKSHATGYAVLAIQTAWLSKYYPIEFMTALLNCNINKNDKLEHYISKMRNNGFKLLGPCVNKSDILFSIDYTQSAIRFGLKGIKGLGASSSLVINSRAGEDFTSLTDFVTRLNTYFKCDKSLLESIAKCGAFEDIEPNRKAIVESAEMIAESLKKDKKKNVDGQISLFEAFSEVDESLAEIGSVTLKNVEDYNKDEKLAFEKELLSFYVSGHPLDKYENIIRNAKDLTSISDIKSIFGEFEDNESYDVDDLGFANTDANTNFTIIGQIVEEKVIQTKRGDLMSKIILEDISGEISCTLFPRTRESYRSRLIKGNVVVVTGKAENSDFGLQIIVDDVSSPQILSTSQNPYAIKVLCPFSRTGAERPKSINMYNVLRNYVNSLEGKEEVEIIFIVEDKEISLGKIPANINTFMKFKQAFGDDKLIFEY